MEPGVRDGQPFIKKGGIPFGREAEPRRCMEVAVGMGRGHTFEKYWWSLSPGFDNCSMWEVKDRGKPDVTLIFLRLRELDATNQRRCGKTNCQNRFNLSTGYSGRSKALEWNLRLMFVSTTQNTNLMNMAVLPRF